jgi:hypothetical protein
MEDRKGEDGKLENISKKMGAEDEEKKEKIRRELELRGDEVSLNYCLTCTLQEVAKCFY